MKAMETFFVRPPRTQDLCGSASTTEMGLAFALRLSDDWLAT